MLCTKRKLSAQTDTDLSLRRVSVGLMLSDITRYSGTPLLVHCAYNDLWEKAPSYSIISVWCDVRRRQRRKLWERVGGRRMRLLNSETRLRLPPVLRLPSFFCVYLLCNKVGTRCKEAKPPTPDHRLDGDAGERAQLLAPAQFFAHPVQLQCVPISVRALCVWGERFVSRGLPLRLKMMLFSASKMWWLQPTDVAMSSSAHWQSQMKGLFSTWASGKQKTGIIQANVSCSYQGLTLLPVYRQTDK